LLFLELLFLELLFLELLFLEAYGFSFNKIINAKGIINIYHNKLGLNGIIINNIMKNTDNPIHIHIF
jgi:hypothetical protein